MIIINRYNYTDIDTSNYILKHFCYEKTLHLITKLVKIRIIKKSKLIIMGLTTSHTKKTSQYICIGGIIECILQDIIQRKKQNGSIPSYSLHYLYQFISNSS